MESDLDSVIEQLEVSEAKRAPPARPAGTFPYLKVTILNHTPDGVVEKCRYFLNLREVYDNQLKLGLDEQVWKHYRTISRAYLSRLKNGRLYTPKTKPSLSEFLRIDTVFLTPQEYMKYRDT